MGLLQQHIINTIITIIKPVVTWPSRRAETLLAQKSDECREQR